MRLLTSDNARFVWLQGAPGTGKTAIAKSIADSLDQEKRLAASFFWDKTGGRAHANTIELFPSTLAGQLTTFSQDYEMLLVNRLLDRTSRSALKYPLEKRMDELVIQPMSLISEAFSSAKYQPVIVLDGLDECGDNNALAQLMELVLLLDKLPHNFVILVSSRPEPEVRDAWSSRDIPCVYMDNIPKNDTDDTIGEMVRDGLAKIHQSRLPDWGPSDSELCAFIQICRQLPALAELRIREVRFLTRTLTLPRAFRRVMDDAAVATDLSGEYLRILRRAYSGAPPDVLRTYRGVVGAVIAAREPLSMGTTSKILGISREDILAALNPIGSIIDVPTSDGGLARFYHATTKEFLIGPPQGNKDDEEFFISNANGAFLIRLLKTLNTANNLKCNMSTEIPLSKRIIRPSRFSAVGRDRDENMLGQDAKHVAYAAENWSKHLDLSSASEELWEELRLFLATKLLFWIELPMNPVLALEAALKQEKVSRLPSLEAMM